MRAKKHRAKRPFPGACETPGNFYKCLQWREVCTLLCLTSLPDIDSVFQDWKIMSGFMDMDACAPSTVTAQ